MASQTVQTKIKKVSPASVAETEDILASEEPLEISLVYGLPGKRISRSISVTMRTPGRDAELAAGFLFTEGIIKDASEIMKITGGVPENTVTVELAAEAEIDLQKLERHFYTTSSCGVCGKSSIDAVKTVCRLNAGGGEFSVSTSLVYRLPGMLRKQQEVFEFTGGLHASALFDRNGELLIVREDVGRHNALDKLIGAALQEGLLPLDKHILLLSGRASFELIQKAAMAGIRITAAVGAPSSLAVQTAKEFDMTLIGFLRGERFNIYSGEKRIGLDESE